ncbi:MAG: FecCD family ABC transporter permease, partial [Egibacteraceae bacterium]
MTNTDRVGEAPVAPVPSGFPGAAPLHHAAARRRRFTLVIAVLVAAVLAVSMAAIMVGAVAVSPGKVARVLSYHLLGWGEPMWTAAEESIIWKIRFPRVLLGLMIGAGLSVVGLAIQAMVRNPIADPFVLGVSSGASLGAVIAIFYAGSLGGVVPSIGAFLGALGALVVVFVMSQGGGRLSSIRLLLIGVSLSYSLSGVASFFLYAAPDASAKNQILFWILGSFGAASLSGLWPPLVALVATLAFLSLRARRLNALAVGDEAAIALGVDPHRLRAELLVATSLFVGASVAAAGPIGFVGLV